MRYGYDGRSEQRVVATVRGVRKSIAWGDGITADEVEPFRAHPDYEDVVIETIEDKAAESALYPLFAGVC